MTPDMFLPDAGQVTLSQDQQLAHDEMLSWWDDRKPLKTLGGLAGTGKTTIIGRLVRSLRKLKKAKRPRKIAFCAFTGKAANVLRTKLEAARVLRDDWDYCGTIHGLIYAPKVEDGVVVGWKLKSKAEMDYGLIVVDEASMLDEKLFEDLKQYRIPILAVGDHGQLPPIEGRLNLMAAPEIKLEKIHRQAEGNPIIRLSMMAREGQAIAPGSHGDFVTKVTDWKIVERVKDPANLMAICGTNRTRQQLNGTIRRRLGFEGTPKVGEKVICLKNNREAGIFNGMTGTLKAIEPDHDHWYKARIAMDGGETFEDRISKHQFGAMKTLDLWENMDPKKIGDRFDFGYALTAHKAQGSEADRVMVFEECSWMESEDLRRRWLYTAITRARTRLLLVGR